MAAAAADALFDACRAADAAAVRNILQSKDVDVFQTDDSGKSALHFCGEHSNIECAKLLLQHAPSFSEFQDRDGISPLHLAALSGNCPLIKLLLTHYNVNVNLLDNEQHTAVHWAVAKGQLSALKVLLSHGAGAADPDIYHAYPLHYATQIQDGGAAIAQLLLDRKCEIDCMDGVARTPLLWSAAIGNLEVCRVLVRCGAALHLPDKSGLSAAHCAASRGHHKVLKFLLKEASVSVDAVDKNGCTALSYAVTLGHELCVEVLLEHGADVNTKDKRGRTACHCAVAKGRVGLLQTLLRHHADPGQENAVGDSPLHEGAVVGVVSVVRMLLEQDAAGVDRTNRKGQTALHIAAYQKHCDVCELLLQHGADPNITVLGDDGDLLTSVDLSADETTRRLLELHGGRSAQMLEISPPEPPSTATPGSQKSRAPAAAAPTGYTPFLPPLSPLTSSAASVPASRGAPEIAQKLDTEELREPVAAVSPPNPQPSDAARSVSPSPSASASASASASPESPRRSGVEPPVFRCRDSDSDSESSSASQLRLTERRVKTPKNSSSKTPKTRVKPRNPPPPPPPARKRQKTPAPAAPAPAPAPARPMSAATLAPKSEMERIGDKLTKVRLKSVRKSVKTFEKDRAKARLLQNIRSYLIRYGGGGEKTPKGLSHRKGIRADENDDDYEFTYTDTEIQDFWRSVQEAEKETKIQKKIATKDEVLHCQKEELQTKEEEVKERFESVMDEAEDILRRVREENSMMKEDLEDKRLLKVGMGSHRARVPKMNLSAPTTATATGRLLRRAHTVNSSRLDYDKNCSAKSAKTVKKGKPKDAAAVPVPVPVPTADKKRREKTTVM